MTNRQLTLLRDSRRALFLAQGRTPEGYVNDLLGGFIGMAGHIRLVGEKAAMTEQDADSVFRSLMIDHSWAFPDAKAVHEHCLTVLDLAEVIGGQS